jgi:hypothetical protein
VLAKQAGITDPKILDISYHDFKLLSPPDIEPSDQAAKNILAQFPDVSQKVEDYVDGASSPRCARMARSRRWRRNTGPE